MGKLFNGVVCVVVVMGGVVACGKGNDTPSCAKIGNVSASEGDPDPANVSAKQAFQIIVTFTGCVDAGKLNYRTIAGTATEGADFVALAESRDFVAGDTSQSVTVLVVRDDTAERDERFWVAACPSPLIVVKDHIQSGLAASALVTILDDDGRVASAVSAISASGSPSVSNVPDGYGCGR